MRGSSVTCPTQPTGRIRPSSAPGGASLTDLVLRRGEALHLGLGLSCCSSPSEPDLGVVWGRHRPALVNMLLTLQVSENLLILEMIFRLDLSEYSAHRMLTPQLFLIRIESTLEAVNRIITR